MQYLKSFSLLLVLLVISCNSTQDLSKFNLSAEERKEWYSFKSQALDISLQHPEDVRVSDSENIKRAIVMISDRGKRDRVKFKMVLKVLDNPSDDLLMIGEKMEDGASYQYNYNRKTSGLTNYGGKPAYHHEYTTSTFLGEETRFYTLIYPINGVRHLVTFEAATSYFFGGKKKMHKILRSIR